MAKQGILDIEKLNRYAKDYDNVLRTLPYFTFQEFAAAMKLNVIEIENEDVIVNARRKAGHTGPYKAGFCTFTAIVSPAGKLNTTISLRFTWPKPFTRL